MAKQGDVYTSSSYQVFKLLTISSGASALIAFEVAYFLYCRLSSFGSRTRMIFKLYI